MHSFKNLYVILYKVLILILITTYFTPILWCKIYIITPFKKYIFIIIKVYLKFSKICLFTPKERNVNNPIKKMHIFK